MPNREIFYGLYLFIYSITVICKISVEKSYCMSLVVRPIITEIPMTLFRAHYVVVQTRYVSVLEVSHHSLHLLKSILERLKTNNINLQYWNYINCV